MAEKEIKKEVDFATLNIYKKLTFARIKLQNAKCKKTGKNSFAGFDYFQLEDFIPTLNVIFSEIGLLGVFNISTESDIDHGQAKLIIYNTDNTNESIEFVTPTANANLKGCTPIQSLGGVHTYLKRYLYLNALEITEGDMLDSQTGSKNYKVEDKPNKSKPMSPYQKRIVTTQMEKKYQDYACQKYNIPDVSALTYDQAEYIINSLTKKGLLKDTIHEGESIDEERNYN